MGAQSRQSKMTVALLSPALVLLQFAALAWLAWRALALAAVLVVKSSLEERWMRASHPTYRAYAQRTTRFIPFLC